jgi:hypothetical protein
MVVYDFFRFFDNGWFHLEHHSFTLDYRDHGLEKIEPKNLKKLTALYLRLLIVYKKFHRDWMNCSRNINFRNFDSILYA